MSSKKILLIGDFSSVHSELKKSLEILGHQVTLVSGGDDFKNFKRDLDIKKEAPQKFWQKAISLIAELFGLRGMIYYFSIKDKILELNLNSYDYIQVVNVLAIQRCGAFANILFWRELRKSQAKIFLSAIGTDYAYVKASLSKKLRYNYFAAMSLKTLPQFIPSLRFYLFPFYGALFRYAVNSARKVIPGAYDYLLSYEGLSKRSSIIPFPINTSLFGNPITEVPKKIIIFYGKQKGRGLIKGYAHFDKLIEAIKMKYPDRFEIIETVSLPFDEYLKVFKNCHIFLDQTNGHDRGINALIGMAAGKVVFSGGGDESLAPYNLTGLGKKPLMDASPDIANMLKQVDSLVQNPEMIIQISQAAIQFVKQNHGSIEVAKRYLELWERS